MFCAPVPPLQVFSRWEKKKSLFFSFRFGEPLAFVLSEGHPWIGKDGSRNVPQGAGKSLPYFTPNQGSAVLGFWENSLEKEWDLLEQECDIPSRDFRGWDQPRIPLQLWVNPLFCGSQDFSCCSTGSELLCLPFIPSDGFDA